ncbi:LIMR family protein [Fagus crenata]
MEVREVEVLSLVTFSWSAAAKDSEYTNKDLEEIQVLVRSAARDCVPQERNSIVSFQASTGVECSAFTASTSLEKTWTMRATFPEYVVALATIVGSILFVIFGGVGIACLPLGLIFSFIRRPKAVITRSQYIKEATELGKKARELKKAADSLHQEEISGSKGRKWHKNVKAVGKVCFTLGIRVVGLVAELKLAGTKLDP